MLKREEFDEIIKQATERQEKITKENIEKILNPDGDFIQKQAELIAKPYAEIPNIAASIVGEVLIKTGLIKFDD